MITFSLVGDIMLGGEFSEHYVKYQKSFLPDGYFPLFKSDVVFANLEAPCSKLGKPEINKILVYSKKEPLKILTKMNINVVNLANNHILDYGIEAANETMEELDKLGIVYSGVGKNLTDAEKPALLNTDNGVVAFLCFSWIDQWSETIKPATKTSPGVNPLIMDHVLGSIRKTKSEFSPAITAVSLHWEEGKSHYTRPESIIQARQMINNGADLIIGHHTHCLQGYEIFNNKPIFYGLGNFLCSPYRKLPNKRLTYDNEGIIRTRNLRERKTIIANLTMGNDSKTIVSVTPLVQARSKPLLLQPDDALKKKIIKDINKLSSRIKSKNYRYRYPYYRRADEIKRVLEDFKEEGFKDLTWKTPFNILRKLITGKSLG